MALIFYRGYSLWSTKVYEQYKLYLPTGWFYMALAYHKSCDLVKIYWNGYQINSTSGKPDPLPIGLKGWGWVRISQLDDTVSYKYPTSVMVDDLKFWDRPLTSQEIWKVYHNS